VQLTKYNTFNTHDIMLYVSRVGYQPTRVIWCRSEIQHKSKNNIYSTGNPDSDTPRSPKAIHDRIHDQVALYNGKTLNYVFRF